MYNAETKNDEELESWCREWVKSARSGGLVETNCISEARKKKAMQEFLPYFKYLPPLDFRRLEDIYSKIENALQDSNPRLPLPNQEHGERQFAHCKRLAILSHDFGLRPHLPLICKMLAHDLLEESTVGAEQITVWWGSQVCDSVRTMTMPGSGPGTSPPIEMRRKLWEQIDACADLETKLVAILDGIDSAFTHMCLTVDQRQRKIAYLREFCLERWIPRIRKRFPDSARKIKNMLEFLISDMERHQSASMSGKDKLATTAETRAFP